MCCARVLQVRTDCERANAGPNSKQHNATSKQSTTNQSDSKFARRHPSKLIPADSSDKRNSTQPTSATSLRPATFGLKTTLYSTTTTPQQWSLLARSHRRWLKQLERSLNASAFRTTKQSLQWRQQYRRPTTKTSADLRAEANLLQLAADTATTAATTQWWPILFQSGATELAFVKYATPSDIGVASKWASNDFQ